MIRLDTIKLLEKNTGRRLFDINHSNIFLDLPPKAKETKAKREQNKTSTKQKEKLLNRIIGSF